NEACLNANWIHEDLTHKNAQEFTKKVLNFMREKLSDYQEEYGDLYNLEATPAESTSYRLAKHDVKRYPDIITASKDGGTPYYTNSSHLPVGYTEDVFTALDIQDELQVLYTSGTVFHTFLGQKLPSWEATAKLVRKIAENYRLPYYTISPTYSVCPVHGYITGEVYKCPECGRKTEVYSRITGYYRPVQNWNDGKAEEFKQRKTYDIDHSSIVGKGIHKEETKHEEVQPLNEILLFTTKTCPNCKMAKMLLDKAQVKYVAVDAEDNAEATKHYGIKKAPTLLVPTPNGVEVYDNVSLIKGYIEKNVK
ncbi:MAG: anaerobic ribonucleoside-triphosphate reductase, partial [Bacilli bacterium]|nr:anaerobic ribonucleoside-triphosphate reductase [Bacilli bacterium]